MEKNNTCSEILDNVTHQCRVICTEHAFKVLSEYITRQLWPVQAMLLLNVILAGVIVGIGAYGHRYRHYGFTRYLLLAATTLFLPIISYVFSATGSTSSMFNVNIDNHVTAECRGTPMHSYMIVISTCLVLISAINTSPIVATDDREDRSIRPPFQLLLQGIWMFYLAFTGAAVPVFPGQEIGFFRFTPFALIYAKMALKCYAFLKAWKSFDLGRNPRLIVGYMQQLREGSDECGVSPMDEDVPPPLVVMGEDERQVEKQPHGYMFTNNSDTIQDGGLVTIDKVWQLLDNMFLIPVAQFLKDTCLSFALFKLLRCRFARYKLTDVSSTETPKFVRSVLLKDGQHERAFKLIADELSFLHDYYDSPLPVSYSHGWLTMVSMVVSLLSIGCCIGLVVDSIVWALSYNKIGPNITIFCYLTCRDGFYNSDRYPVYFGNMYFDLVPALLLSVFVMVSEASDIASHICSSWTKVILTCRCVHRASLKLSPVVPKWIGFLLRCRCNRLMRHWNDKMRQNSLLMLHPRQLVLPGCLSRLLGPMNSNAEVPTAVKASIINALRSTSSGGLSKGITSLSQSQVGTRSLVWACNNSKGTSNTILVWHIATTILEVRHPPHHQQGQPSVSDKKIAATHLSRYCAYLVESCPELLLDDDAWSKELYKKVKKDAEQALAVGGGIPVSSMPPEAGYRRLIELLGETENHEVLKDAAKLAEQLGQLNGGEEMAWELLAGFWSEMILYLAPSDNIKGHLEAIDRGGELITLLWALLTHVGIFDRPDNVAAATSASATGV